MKIGVIVANKVDLSGRRCIAASQGKEFAKSVGFAYFECSATEGIAQVEPFMLYVANAVQAKYEQTIKKLQGI